MKIHAYRVRTFHHRFESENVAYCFPGRSIRCVSVRTHSAHGAGPAKQVMLSWSETRQRWREKEDVTMLSYPCCCSLLLVQTERAFTHIHTHAHLIWNDPRSVSALQHTHHIEAWTLDSLKENFRVLQPRPYFPIFLGQTDQWRQFFFKNWCSIQGERRCRQPLNDLQCNLMGHLS